MKFLLSLSVLFLLMFNCCSNPDTPPAAADPVNKLMAVHADTLLADPKISAVSIGIFRGGNSYTGHFGELDKDSGNKPTDETIYEIASTSKTLTGLLVANAVIENRLSLEADIRDYLEEDFPNFERGGEPIRIKHLLAHTSRMPRFLPASVMALFTDFNESLPFKMAQIQRDYTKTEFMQDLHRMDLDTLPGTLYSYSNVDTELMAKILENIYGKPFNDLVKSFFATEAGMINTSVLLSPDEEAQLANGYGMTGKIVPHEVIMFGADGGMKTTMPDLVRYMALQLDGDNEIVAESQRVIYADGGREMAYYWPVRNSDEYGKFFSIHGGGFGMQNWLFILPQHKLGVSVVTNQSDLETAEKLMQTVHGLITDLI